MENGNKKRSIFILSSYKSRHISEEQEKKLLYLLLKTPFEKERYVLVKLIDIVVKQELSLSFKHYDDYYTIINDYANMLLFLRKWEDKHLDIKAPTESITLTQNMITVLEDAFESRLRFEGESFLLGIERCYRKLEPTRLVTTPTYEEAKDLIKTDVDWPDKYENYFRHNIKDTPFSENDMIEIYRYYTGVICDSDNKSLERIINDSKERLNYRKNNKIKNLKQISVVLCFMKYKTKLTNPDFETIFNCLDTLNLITERKQTWKDDTEKRIKGIKSIYTQAKMYEIIW